MIINLKKNSQQVGCGSKVDLRWMHEPAVDIYHSFKGRYNILLKLPNVIYIRIDSMEAKDILLDKSFIITEVSSL